jgi:hypothetical protein
MAFLGVGAGVASVSMSNMVSMGPAVASMVRSLPPVVVIAAAPPFVATLGLGRKLIAEGFDLVDEGRVRGGKRGVGSNKLLDDGLLVGGSAGKVVRGIVDGVQEAGVVGVGMG